MYYCCIRALGRRVLHILNSGGTGNTWLSAYWEKGESRRDIMDKDMRAGIKMAAQVLDYPGRKGIPVNRIGTHSLRIGGATVLALAGYTDTQTQKMGQCNMQPRSRMENLDHPSPSQDLAQLENLLDRHFQGET